MLILLSALLSTLGSLFRSRAALELENLALRHQIGVLKRSAKKRPPVGRSAFRGSKQNVTAFGLYKKRSRTGV